MTGYEEQLHARAELLEDTGELAAAVTTILAGASGAGVDPDAITGLRAAAAALDPAGAPPGYQAGSPADRHPGTGYRSDSDFLEALSDADDQISDWARETGQLAGQVTAAAGQAHTDLGRARHDLADAREALAAAYAMPTKTDCDGCHGRKRRAIAAAEAAIADAEHRIADATRRIGICDDTADLLDPLGRRLRAALRALRQVPHDLGAVYELIYQFIRRGGQMPRYGRWVTGTTPAAGSPP
jgi:ABC-type transporter Mla subunit MlaD